MTMNMILALGILVFMLVLIMTDALPFGAPPILASLLIVVFGLVPEDASAMGYAMAGFSNNTVWMVAFFMAILGAVQKTSAIEKVRQAMLNLVEKGGFKSYVLLIIVVMLGTTLVGSGQTAYYVLILSLVATIPYNKNLPSSKLMLPLGFATNHPLIPINVALFYGVMASVLESAGESGTVSMVSFAIVNAFISAGFLIWAIIGYKVLPDHEIAAATEEQEQRADAEINQMDAGKEKLAIAMFIIAIVGMMLVNQIGDLAYVIPGLCAFVLLFAKCISWKEMREGIFAPVVLMMAGVIPVANALADSGLTAMVGEAAAGFAGSLSPFMIVFIFSLLTSTAATFTGSNMGSVYIFAPIAIATCQALGVSPLAAAAAVTISGWNGGYMPVDGMPALIYGMGNYKMTEFWKFTIPMYLVRIVFVSLGAVIVFPF